jgi:hypothetical protein
MTTIILTCTVNVKPYIFCMNQTDPNERKDIYLKTVLQWLNKTNFNIVLLENSGYNFDELNNEKQIYKNRFEVITFSENNLEEAKYLKDEPSKGASELFSINYAFKHSKLIYLSNFIIKITGRFFINELEEYLSQFDLNNYDCLTQQDRNRCEMVGSHYKNFSNIFNIKLLDNNNHYDGHVENIWKQRTSKYNNNLLCKIFKIDKTQRGGLDMSYYDI